jgi:hypothetical protein
LTDPVDRLRELATDCLVRLRHDPAESPEDGGSGVWIAPRTVLTCAHVVPAGPRSEVEVSWQGQVFTGVVQAHVPNPDDRPLWPFPDLAILSVPSAPRHPCAWLSERLPAHRAELLAIGHSTKLGEGLRRHRVGCHITGDHDFGSGSYLQVKGNELVGGMSGGPVLDLATGAVCALVTTTIGEDGDRGGYVVPLRGLRHLGAARRNAVLADHDRFHAGDRSWTGLRQGLPAPGPFAGLPVTPAEEVDLLGQFARLPDPGPGVLREIMPGDVPVATLRDAFYRLLDDHGVGDDWIPALLRLGHRLTGSHPPADRLDLYDWCTALAVRTGRREEWTKLRQAPVRPAPASGGVISIEIVPGASRTDRFRFTVSIEDHRRGRRVLHQDSEPRYELTRVRELVTEHLRNGLELLEGNAVVEFVVPVELFDEPFDELRPASPHTTVGRQHHVVLRDYDRQDHRWGRHAWHQRWAHLSGAAAEIMWMTCKEDMDPSDLWSALGESPGTSVMALTRRPTSNDDTVALIRSALEAGVPALVWRRDTCPEHDSGAAEAGCSGEKFRQAIDGVLGARPLGELPEQVRRLRNRAASSRAGAADQVCRGTVLVWDDPGRAAPPAPLLSPQES